MKFDPSTFEPLISDQRLERLVDKLRSEFGPLENFEFATFIQPARDIQKETPAGILVKATVQEMAVFAALAPRPRSKKAGSKLMSTGTVSLRDWREAEAEAAHYAGAKDHAHAIYRVVVKDLLGKLDDLRSLIN